LSENIVWQAFLNALAHADLEYKSVHRAITVVFVSHDCGADSEWLADVTLDRVAQKIYKGEEVRSIVAYSKKFADLVWKEYCRAQEKFRKAMSEWVLLVPDRYEPEKNIDLRRQCQKECLKRLSENELQLLVDYYLMAKDRAELARDLGLVIATLRTNIHRLNLRLIKCVEACRRSA
jgi:DNA-directed RNA polymerase specialized sigma24 family protein